MNKTLEGTLLMLLLHMMRMHMYYEQYTSVVKTTKGSFMNLRAYEAIRVKHDLSNQVEQST
jgi:hypothetical protein